MNDHVSPELAKRLALAGFPQPSPAVGQWWAVAGEVVFVASAGDRYFTVIRFFPGARPLVDEYFDLLDFEGLVFMPGVSDVLKLLPGEGLTFSDENFTVCDYRTINDELFDVFISSNQTSPATACAESYIEKNEKK